MRNSRPQKKNRRKPGGITKKELRRIIRENQKIRGAVHEGLEPQRRIPGGMEIPLGWGWELEGNRMKARSKNWLNDLGLRKRYEEELAR